MSGLAGETSECLGPDDATVTQVGDGLEGHGDGAALEHPRDALTLSPGLGLFVAYLLGDAEDDRGGGLGRGVRLAARAPQMVSMRSSWEASLTR